MTSIPRTCAFLSMDSLAGYVNDDALAVPAMARRGWTVDTVPWRREEVDWGRYAAVVVRSPWDYYEAPDAFLQTLARIDASPARLFNPVATIAWNLDKRYLADVAERGHRIVPTLWEDGLDPGDAERLFDALATDRLVVKPRVGANAKDTYRLTRGDTERLATAARRLAHTPLLVQPFLARIQEEGEYSLFFFDGAFSHAIQKQPARGDFRVQEEHGGLIRPVRPDPDLVRNAEAILRDLEEPLLYARVDVALTDAGEPALMELELIEPSLYFRMDPGAPDRFAEALVRFMTR